MNLQTFFLSRFCDTVGARVRAPSINYEKRPEHVTTEFNYLNSQKQASLSHTAQSEYYPELSLANHNYPGRHTFHEQFHQLKSWLRDSLSAKSQYVGRLVGPNSHPPRRVSRLIVFISCRGGNCASPGCKSHPWVITANENLSEGCGSTGIYRERRDTLAFTHTHRKVSPLW